MKTNLQIEKFNHSLTEAALFFRKIAFEIENNPEAINGYLSHPAIEGLINGESLNCLARVKLYEALGYGDAGVLLACPGASLAGMMMEELGDQQQKQQFYQYVKTANARTCLAVTEPNSGSNIRQITTRLYSHANQWFLFGEKWLVGHGATASIGVVIAKMNEGPLGIRAILLTPEVLNNQSTHITRMVLPMAGLKGARLGRLIFNHAVIEHECVLGKHLKVAEQGMVPLIKTFNRMRPCVGALAIGVAQAVVDYMAEHQKTKKNKLQHLNRIIAVSRELLYQAAMHVEKNPFDSNFSSLAKVKATKTAEAIAHAIQPVMGRYAFIEHPYLEKWYRDIWGFEYMEGTQNMHKMNVFNAYHRDNDVFL